MSHFDHFFTFFFGRSVESGYICGSVVSIISIITHNTIMLKTFKTPSIEIVHLEETDVIATSPNGVLGVDPTENVDFADKARSRSIWNDE